MFITHNGAQLYTVEFGSGPATLVAHGGWAGSWELWTDPFACLSKTWRTVAYDHRGTGATVAAPDSITLDALVDDLFAVLDSLGIDTCVLAGESAGAAVVLTAALRQPGRFAGLVLVDAMYYREAPARPQPFVLGLQHDFEGTIGAFVDACVVDDEPNCAAVRRWGRQILRRSGREAAIKLFESMNGVDLRPEVQHITQPTLIIHGDRDVIVPQAQSEWLARQLPHSTLRIVEGAGHVPTITRPLEVADTINRFFAGLTG